MHCNIMLFFETLRLLNGISVVFLTRTDLLRNKKYILLSLRGDYVDHFGWIFWNEIMCKSVGKWGGSPLSVDTSIGIKVIVMMEPFLQMFPKCNFLQLTTMWVQRPRWEFSFPHFFLIQAFVPRGQFHQAKAASKETPFQRWQDVSPCEEASLNLTVFFYSGTLESNDWTDDYK